MSPTLVFERTAGAPTAVYPAGPQSGADVSGQRLAMVLGSPGGATIISYVARVLLDVLAEGVSLQRAIESPHAASRNGPTELENEPRAAALAEILTSRGHRVRTGPMTSGLHGIIRSCDNAGANCILESGTDPRREGTARGR